eukprot:3377788-Karenia_brevis.AAC.1
MAVDAAQKSNKPKSMAGRAVFAPQEGALALTNSICPKSCFEMQQRKLLLSKHAVVAEFQAHGVSKGSIEKCPQ